MLYLRASSLLVLALLIGMGVRADDLSAPSSRAPVMRAPTSGKTVNSILPHKSRAETQSDLYFLPSEDVTPAKTSCIRTSSIRKADVRDDSTIRLTVAKNKQIDMKLYGICPGLAFDESFYYQPGPTMELCARFDTIMARSGSRCLIDAFVPVESKSKK